MSTGAAAIREVHAEVIPLMAAARAALVAEQMNPVEKNDRAKAILDAIGTHGFRSANLTAVQVQAAETDRRNKLWAEYYAIKETESVSDLTTERRTYWHSSARKDLPDWQSYSHALYHVRTIEEENLGLEEPSRTHAALKERERSAAYQVGDALSFALESHEIELLRAIAHGRGGARRRFRVVRTLGGYPRPLRMIDAPVRAPFARFDFEWYATRAKTQTEIRLLLRMWATEYRAERREQGTVIVGDGFEVIAQ